MPAKKDYRTLCLRVSALLKKERERQRLSMTILSANAGLSQPSLSYIERGMRIPNLETLFRIADALNVELSEIIAKAAKS